MNPRLQDKRRHGSVLILVVALLVLLALIGTAWMSSVTIERGASAQNSANVQIDLLVEGVKNIAEATIAGDLFGNGQFKPNDSAASSATATYGNFDWPQVDPLGGTPPTGPADRYIASRIPTKLSTNQTVWTNISVVPGLGNFESPYNGGGSTTYNGHNFVQPNAVNINGIDYPALTIPAGAGGGTFLAGDADGDGVADSGLYRLPIGQINGVSYYVAVRIVDNGSAINFNTAWSSNWDWNAAVPGTRMPSTGYFPSGVGLMDILQDYVPAGTLYNTFGPDLAQLNNWRLGLKGVPANVAQLGVLGTPSWPLVDSPVKANRTDFKFYSLGEALSAQLGSRLDNPGFYGAPATNNPYGSLPAADTTSVAYRMCVINRAASQSQIETLLAKSIYGIGAATYQSKPYPATPAGIGTWAADLDYDRWFDSAGVATGTFHPLRPILTGTNGVANTIPVKSVTPPPAAPTPPQPAPFMAQYTGHVAPPKTNINTAPFNELWRAFWSVMSEDGINGPYVAAGGDQRMFRSPMRLPQGVADPLAPYGGQLTPDEMLQIRAAIAAVNAMDLRDGDEDVTTQQVRLRAGPSSLVVNVFGTEKQPFITEIYADNISGPIGPQINPKGFIGIELYNPYPQELVLRKWRVGVIDRRGTPDSGGNGTPFNYPLSVHSLMPRAGEPPAISGYLSGDGVNPVVTIPAMSYVVLTNRPGAGDAGRLDPSRDATYDPFYCTVSGTRIFVPNLSDVLESGTETGGELVLLRPRRSDGVASVDPAGRWNEDPVSNTGTPAAGLNPQSGGYMNDLVPVDSFDFTGIAQTDPGAPSYYLWHYIRLNAPGGPTAWKFVYPGAYGRNAAMGISRHEGVDIPPSFTDADPSFYLPAQQAELGTDNTTSAIAYSNPFPGIQLSNSEAPGANLVPPPWDASIEYGAGEMVTKAAGTAVNRYRARQHVPAGTPVGNAAFWDALGANVSPFGGFARNGDILQVPFMGGYRISPAAPLPNGAFFEMNSVTLDCSFARYTGNSASLPADTVGTPSGATVAEQEECLGRFCPILDPAATPTVNDLDPTGSYSTTWRYRWATRLFDYLTVQAPSADYYPNVDPGYDENYPAPGPVRYKYTPSNPAASEGVGAPGYPVPVKNGTAVASDAGINNQAGGNIRPASVVGTEDLIPIEGLININTAPWYVLARLPLVLYTAAGGPNPATPALVGTVDQQSTNDLAKLIVRWRDGDPTFPDTNFQQPHGPFRSIFDLNLVKDPTSGLGFQNALMKMPMDTSPANDPDQSQRDFAPTLALPGAPAPPPSGPFPRDGVRNDSEEKFLAMTRISNLITTRSDSFTIYIQVQGWRDADTDHPELVVQRRAAFVADRSGVTSVNNSLKITNIPTN